MDRVPASPRVSIITPLYNSSKFIGETLDSVLRQTYANWESILVDDGSTDDTPERVKAYLTDSRFRYLRQENQGIAGARNTGIRAARGEWICLLDHDDRWLPEKLEKQVAYALAHACQIVCTDAFIVRGQERWVYSRGFQQEAKAVQRSVSDSSVDVFEQLLRVNFMCTSSVMVHASVFERFGLLDPQAAPADDYEMWIRCMPDVKIGFVGEPLIEYALHEHNFSRNEIRMLEKAIYALEKIRPRHLHDRRRLKQFDDFLVYQYGQLFDRLLEEKRAGAIFGRALSLLPGGPASWRVLARALSDAPLARLRNSVRHHLRLERSL